MLRLPGVGAIAGGLRVGSFTCTGHRMSAALPVVTYGSTKEGWAGRQDPTLPTLPRIWAVLGTQAVLGTWAVLRTWAVQGCIKRTSTWSISLGPQGTQVYR